MYVAQVKVDNKRVMHQIRQLSILYPGLTWVDGTSVATPLSQMSPSEVRDLTCRTCYLSVFRSGISGDYFLDYRNDDRMTFGDSCYGKVLNLITIDIRKELTA